MSTFHGPQYKGAMRDHRRVLREEAEARNAKTPPERRASYRRKHRDAVLPSATLPA
jgi:hypothetical protein